MTAEPLPSLERSTLREQALAALRSAILSGRYGPGDHLGEVEIASYLSISRGTVREALRHLQQEGLVAPGVRGKLMVRSLSPDEVRELYRVRGALEGLAVGEIVSSGRAQQAVAGLEEALGALERAESLEERIEADLGFHARLCELSGNSMLLQSWKHLEGPTRVVVVSATAGERALSTSAEHHRPIVQAIGRGDAAAARAVLDEHMSEAAERLTTTA
ncbi:GntR family transcriptional regulator [Saccharopolyspora griseoalba]|uniref:GntR family transcriptional regulator n=1 Tax=Saccharopolyspora griseoalba TaxID=1431848 RepID=A0ABW2LDJ8_9PSEU